MLLYRYLNRLKYEATTSHIIHLLCECTITGQHIPVKDYLVCSST